MWLLILAIALLALAAILRYDHTMPTWARRTLMLATIAIIATSIVITLAIL